MVGVMVYVSKRLATLSGKYFIQQQKDLGAANGYIEEMMQGQKVVKVFCHEEKSIEEFKKLNDELFHSADNANKFANIATVSYTHLKFIPSGAKTQKKEIIPYPRCGFGACLRCA